MTEAWREPYTREARIYREQYHTAARRDLRDIATSLGEIRLHITDVESALGEAYLDAANPQATAPSALAQLRIAQTQLTQAIAELEEFTGASR
jgi:hypothetical protein